MNPNILPSFHFPAGTRFAQSQPVTAPSVTLASPALSVMTDLALVRAATVRPEESLLMAREHMIHQGVRLLFVVSDMPCVEGLITTTDLDGERPMQVISRRGVKYEELTVKDVMSSLASLDAIDLDELAHADVAKVVATLQQLGRRHLLVVQKAGSQHGPQVRGVISQAQVERQLGRPIEMVEVAQNFAEISVSLAD
jgi:CBS-domain-containing membrane protein